MSKFGTPPRTSTMPKPLAKVTGRIRSHEGAIAHSLDPKTDLYLAAVTSLVEPKFYDSGDGSKRLAGLTRAAVAEDPEWVATFARWLRHDGNMRSASIIVGAEYVAGGGPNGRKVIDSVIVRADEPGEMVGYWFSRYGKTMPAAVKRGIADACVRLYDERNTLKYDGKAKQIRFADVIEICHPKPKDAQQSAVFKWCIDRRHNRDSFEVDLLPTVGWDTLLMELPEGERRGMLDRAIKTEWSWERVAGWIPGGMDAEAWEALIPSMGYMALLRNIRNFEQAKVSAKVLDAVAEKISDPEQVRRSRQFPYRFWSAYRATDSTRFAHPLEQALDISTENIPELDGRTLVLIDTSASMSDGWGVGHRSGVNPVDIAGLFGCSIHHRNFGRCDAAIYGDTSVKFNQFGSSVLPSMRNLRDRIGDAGHGTNTWGALSDQYDGHDRVIVLSDMQDHPSRHTLPDVPVYVFDLAGYGKANIEPKPGRYLFGGFTDAHFRLIPMLEAGNRDAWPWE